MTTPPGTRRIATSITAHPTAGYMPSDLRIRPRERGEQQSSPCSQTRHRLAEQPKDQAARCLRDRFELVPVLDGHLERVVDRGEGQRQQVLNAVHAVRGSARLAPVRSLRRSQ